MDSLGMATKIVKIYLLKFNFNILLKL